MEQKHERTYYRVSPCPPYDVEGTESWLTDLARRGLFLKRDGFFAGIGAFERREPAEVRYRLEASEKPVGLMSETDAPPEVVELSASCGWEYLGARGQFFVYRTEDAASQELNTDPQVQALAVNAVRKRQLQAFLTSLFWLVIYPLLLRRTGIVLLILNVGSLLTLSGAALAVWSLVRELRAALLLGKLRKKLRAGSPPDHGKNWKRRAYRNLAGGWALGILFAVWIGFALNAWQAADRGTGEIPLADYTGKPPFATLAELAPAGEYIPENLQWTNTVLERSDPLAPRSIIWDETATILLPEGADVSGGLHVRYFQTISPLLARIGAWEYELRARWSGRCEPLELPEGALDGLPVDSAFAYLDEVRFPAVVLRAGDVLIWAQFYQTGSEKILPEDWIRTLAESAAQAADAS